MKQYHVCKPGGAPEGPYPEDMVKACYKQGVFPDGTLIWCAGEPEWMLIQQVFAETQAATVATPPPLPSSINACLALGKEKDEVSLPTDETTRQASSASPIQLSAQVATIATPPPFMPSACPVPPPPPQEGCSYYVARPGMQPQGGYTKSVVLSEYYRGVYPSETKVWGPDTGGWVPIQQLCHPAGFAYPVGGMPETPAFPWKQPKTWNPITAFTSCMSRYVQFSGRASRSEYWFYQLVTMIVIGVTTAIAGAMTGDEDIAEIVCLVTSLPFILPYLAVQSRRLHDMGLSAWWLLLCLLPNIGAIILMIISCWGSKNENNPYGTGALPPV